MGKPKTPQAIVTAEQQGTRPALKPASQCWRRVGIMFTIIGYLASMTTAIAADRNAIGENMGYLIGTAFGTLTLLRNCSLVVPDLKNVLSQKSDAIRSANSQIIQMAEDKLLALVDLHEGKEKRIEAKRRLEVDIPRLAAETAADVIRSAPDRAALCRRLSTVEVRDLILSRQYPGRVDQLFELQAGYPWRPPNCEYLVTFPVQHEVQYITINGVQNIRAMTPDDNRTPAIRASCWEMLKPRPQVIDLLKRDGERLWQDFGVRNTQWIETETPRGHQLVAIGTRQAFGISFTMANTILVGRHSVLEVLITEAADQYPSLQATQFIDWIERH